MAGSANLGNASLVLSTAGGKLTSGMASAGNDIKSWAGKTSASVKQHFAGITPSIKSSFGSIASFAKGGLVGLAAGFGATALTSGLGGTVDKLKEMASVGRQAKSLGIASDQFMGLSLAAKRAGVEGEAFGGMIAKMGKKITDAQFGNKEAAASFQALGLDIGQLAAMAPDKQFIAIADSISKIGPPGQQAHAAMRLFEEQGIKLLPMLQKGGAGIQSFIDAQKKMGTAIDQAGMDKIMRAQQALPKLGAAWEGLSNKILVAMAPVIELVASKLSAGVAKLAPLFEWIGRALSTHWGIIADIVGEVVDVIWDAVSAVVEWVGELFDSASSSMTVGEVIETVWKSLIQVFAYAWDVVKMGAGAFAFLAGMAVEGFGKIVTAFKDTIKELLDIAGELPDSLGGDMFREASKGVDKFGEKVTKAGQDMQKWGKGTITNFGKSADDVSKWFDKRKSKKESLEDVAKAGVDAAAGGGLLAYTKNAAMLQGSKEAYSVESRFRWEGANLAKPKKVEEEQLAVMKQVKGILDSISKATGFPLMAG